jgi:excisionase family DNA binding protein
VKELLTAQELSEVLNLSVDTIWRYTREKRIPVIELGKRQYRYDKDAVLAALTGKNSITKEKRPAYGSQAGYTYEDYVRIPDEPGYRYEVLEGFLVRDPSPGFTHQRVVRELGCQLMAYFNEVDPEGEFIFAPLDVTLTDRNVVQPDLVFVSSDRLDIICEERIDGPCYLVVEVMSPASRRRDRLQKMEIYRKAGIPHYWLADTEEKTLEAYSLRGGVYALVAAGEAGDMFAHSEFPGLTLDLAEMLYRPRLL